MEKYHEGENERNSKKKTATDGGATMREQGISRCICSDGSVGICREDVGERRHVYESVFALLVQCWMGGLLRPLSSSRALTIGYLGVST